MHAWHLVPAVLGITPMSFSMLANTPTDGVSSQPLSPLTKGLFKCFTYLLSLLLPSIPLLLSDRSFFCKYGYGNSHASQIFTMTRADTGKFVAAHFCGLCYTYTDYLIGHCCGINGKCPPRVHHGPYFGLQLALLNH